MQSQRIAIALGTLAVMIAVGLLSGAAGFGRGEQRAEAALIAEVKKLLASDAEAGDEFGLSVAVSGDTAVVGARHPFVGATGSAYVYQRDQGGTDGWGEVKKLLASDAEADDQFGFSVAISGDTAVVGATHEDAGGSNAGAAYVFGRDEGGTDNWGEVKKLTASDAEPVDFFGRSVALNGETALVGAGLSGALNFGAVYVFGRDEGGAGNWGEVKKLTASDAATGDWFGHSVALDRDTAVVGARFEEQRPGPGWANAGAAYVFGRDYGGTGNWGEVKKLVASERQWEGQFGYHVTISGDTAVVGAGPRADAAYVFQRDQGGEDSWGEVKKLTAFDAQTGDNFGSVALSGDTLVVGAWGGDPGGAAYVFRRDRGGVDNWGEADKLTASDGPTGGFGWSVALSGSTAVVGERGAAAYVFELPRPPPTPTPTITPTPCPPGKVPAPGGRGCGTPTPTPTPCPTGKVPANSGCGTPTPTPASGAMAVDCDASAARIQSDCSYAPGASFQVEVHVTEPPTGGYGLFQVKMAWTEGVLNYLPAADPADEALWGPCNLAARLNNAENPSAPQPSVFFSCVPVPPLTARETNRGAVLTFEMECKSAAEALSPPAALGSDPSVLYLVPFPDAQGGTRFGIGDFALKAVSPALTDATVTCAEPTPGPSGTDSDGDGCGDAHEQGPNPSLGGQRDPSSFWDFFDVPVAGSPRDRIVDAFDIGAVVLRFGTFVDSPFTREEALAQALTPPPDMTSYHAAFDRTLLGLAPWNLGPPDGSIDASDIGAVVVQFGHTCA